MKINIKKRYIKIIIGIIMCVTGIFFLSGNISTIYSLVGGYLIGSNL
jgi:hypothetical protein